MTKILKRVILNFNSSSKALLTRIAMCDAMCDIRTRITMCDIPGGRGRWRLEINVPKQEKFVLMKQYLPEILRNIFCNIDQFRRSRSNINLHFIKFKLDQDNFWSFIICGAIYTCF